MSICRFSHINRSTFVVNNRTLMVARVCVCDHDLSLENSIHRSHSYTTKSRRTNEQIIAQQLDNLHAAARHNLFFAAPIYAARTATRRILYEYTSK